MLNDSTFFITDIFSKYKDCLLYLQVVRTLLHNCVLNTSTPVTIENFNFIFYIVIIISLVILWIKENVYGQHDVSAVKHVCKDLSERAHKKNQFL